MADIPEDLNKVYQQVVEKESNVYNKIYDDISQLEDFKLRYEHAISPESRKELESSEEETDLLEEDKKLEMGEKYENLQDALIKQACFTNFTRNLLYNYEVQKAVVKEVSSLDINTDLATNNNVFKLLKNCSESVDYADEIAKATEDGVKIQREVFSMNKKYINLLHSIESKWSILKGRQAIVDSADAEMTAFLTKVEHRESKLIVLLELLKNIISSNAVQWLENSREINALLLCDAFCSENTEDTNEALELLELSRKSKANISKTRKITSYLRSTSARED